MNIKKKILEITQTKWNYYLSLVTDGATAVVFLLLSLKYSKDMFSSVAIFLLGIFIFTFIEYAVHAWLFHESSLEVFTEGHGHHHKDPFSFDAMPFFMSAVIAVIFLFIFKFIMPLNDAFALIGGMVGGYFNYGIMHHIMHRTEFNNPYWRYMQEFHFVHHKKPKMNHGVTTDIWDRVFNTYYKWDEKDLKGIEKLKRIKK